MKDTENDGAVKDICKLAYTVIDLMTLKAASGRFAPGTALVSAPLSNISTLQAAPLLKPRRRYHLCLSRSPSPSTSTFDISVNT